MQQSVGHWWEHRWTVAFLALLAAVPLLWPTIPPLVDLPGHMGRYRVELGYAVSPVLRDYYDFQWNLIGNLGIDLLIIPVSKIFGLELGVKLIVMAIPVMTVAGLLWIAREVHGRIPPTALFGLPLAYGHPFLFGFVNFSLSMAFALLAFALWLRLARLGQLRLRAAVFLFIGPLLWVTHTFGWGTLGVLAFSAELIRQHDRGGSWPHAIFWAGIHCLSLSPPILLMVAWRSGHVGGQTADWFNWQAKWLWLKMTLRDRFMVFDIASVAALAGILVFALFSRALEFSRNLAASALFLLVVYLLLPRIVFGSAYADMRLTPFMLAIAIIAIRPKPQARTKWLSGLAIVALAFVGARTVVTTYSMARASGDYDRALGALDRLPTGARLVSFVGHSCRTLWSTNRMEHLPAIALVRKDAFSNDQWDMAGALLLRAKRPEAYPLRHDPSQIVTAVPCRGEFWRTLDASLAMLPRTAFDYVWLIDPPAFDPRLLGGMTPVWRNGTNALYRIDDRTPLKRVR
jgi:hypothetical protein